MASASGAVAAARGTVTRDGLALEPLDTDGSAGPTGLEPRRAAGRKGRGAANSGATEAGAGSEHRRPADCLAFAFPDSHSRDRVNPAFDAKEFERVRDNLLTAITRRKDSPPTVANLANLRTYKAVEDNGIDPAVAAAVGGPPSPPPDPKDAKAQGKDKPPAPPPATPGKGPPGTPYRP